MSLFKQHTQEQHRKSLADYLPIGKLFVGKNVGETNLFKLLMGLAAECFRAENNINLVADEYDIETTTLLIEQWESALGLPDDCMNNTTDLEIRRQQVLAKFTLSIDTAESFIELVRIFGFDIEIVTGKSVGVYPLPYPWLYFDSSKTARFTIIVRLAESIKPSVYPFTSTLYPWPYSTAETNIIECLLTHVKPANCNIIFQYVL
jgi:uncharacterized protein YmfQ (DUF2313 family)